MPRLEQSFIEWTLLERPKYQTLETWKMVKRNMTFQLDRSDSGLSGLCHFKANDVIESVKGESATVLGERCECL
jgi:hypothetical protein